MSVSADESDPAEVGHSLPPFAVTILVAIFSAMFACVALQVIARYIAAMPMPWTEELARFLLVVMVHLGAVVVWQRGEHIRSDFFLTRISALGRHWIEVVTMALAVMLLLAVAAGAWDMAVLNWQRLSSSMPWLRIGYLYAVEGVCAVGMALLALRDIWRAAQRPGGEGW